ncbi:MAG: hypothetical protein HZB66_03190 [Candidatus Aenigmarchaeota archaeon]|nr:hypothetical protein [Candidatus Aenigmarchaeota archaeon]
MKIARLRTEVSLKVKGGAASFHSRAKGILKERKNLFPFTAKKDAMQIDEKRKDESRLTSSARLSVFSSTVPRRFFAALIFPAIIRLLDASCSELFDKSA